MAMKSQNEKVLEHIREHGSITSLEAFQEYGITRISGRIYDLKEMGHNIISKDEKGKNRDGKTVRYSRYSLGLDMPTEQERLPLVHQAQSPS